VLPRLKLDIGWGDIAYACWCCAKGGGEAGAQAGAEAAWSPGNPAIFACLSVRTGFDLYLRALALPPGSEILLSAITIQDMATIISAHRLEPVPVDLNPETLQPVPDDLERKRTNKTRAILVAHLFGARLDMKQLVDFAREHNLLLIEDRAQAFTGSRSCVTAEADVSMVSFGPIKTATALGGAILVVRNAERLALMRAIEREYPLFTVKDYWKRIRWFALLKFLSIPLVFGVFHWVLKVTGKDIDKALGGSTRAFSPDALLRDVRRRACGALLRVLKRRLHRYDAKVVRRRARAGAHLQQLLKAGGVRIPGQVAPDHTYWVFPINAEDVGVCVAACRENGFDVTPGASAMRVIGEDRGHNESPCPGAIDVLHNIVYLPVSPDLTASQIERLASLCSSTSKSD